MIPSFLLFSFYRHLKDPFPNSEPDFCSLPGNIPENAIAGCMTSEPWQRRHHLTVTVHNQINLYIVSSNTFNDKVKKKGNRYLSAKKKGNGIGISSIIMTAEKYNGAARFSHSGCEFTAEIMMQISPGGSAHNS